jgi:2-amino-4-hydroxy-6-hydroxymethyldihydropteridine diphosphokinase
LSTAAYIGFGANLGDRKAAFDAAVEALDQLPVTEVTGKSRLYETAPIGISDGGPKFFNGVIVVQTDLSPRDLMAHMREIEHRLGKSSDHRSDLSRVIDLDLLLYGDRQIREDSVEVPHPRMHQRAFVLIPLAEVAPHAVHPLLVKTAAALCELLPPEELQGVRPVDPRTESRRRDALGSS